MHIKTLSAILLVLGMLPAVDAATFTVSKVDDTSDGVCDADCSLREAVAAAGASPGDDTIVFAPEVFGVARTIVLAGSEIALPAGGRIDIVGPGASLLTISGGNTSRIFSTNVGVVAGISGMTLTGGNGAGALNTGRGGAVYNAGGTLELRRVALSDNNAANGGALNNAAVSVVGGNLSIADCVISGNSATGSGGGVQNFSTSTLRMERCAVIGNSAGSSIGGGGAQLNGTVRIVNSTFANNSASVGAGGGLTLNGVDQALTHVTVAGNFAQLSSGGIDRVGSSGFSIRSSIVAGNSSAGAAQDFRGTVASLGTNLVGSPADGSGWIATDLLGVDPLLGPLADNGGPGATRLPLPGSQAIDAGQDCVLDLSCATGNPPEAVLVDQRGLPRRVGGAVDIGAAEAPASFTGLFADGFESP